MEKKDMVGLVEAMSRLDAQLAGAFVEDAMTEQEASESLDAPARDAADALSSTTR